MATKHTDLSRRAAWILVCVLALAGAAYAFSRQQTKKYTATASIAFNANQLAQRIAGLPVAPSGSQQAQQNTNLVQFGDLAAKTAAALGRGLTKESVDAGLSVSAERGATVVNVADTATSPRLAAEIANSYSYQFVAEQQNRERHYYDLALKLIDKQLAALSAKERAGAAGIALRDRAQSLTLARLGGGNVQVARPAVVPTRPSSPKVLRNTLLGAVLGLLLGLGLALLLERLDKRIRDPEDFEAIYDLPLLGVVPASRALSHSGRGRKNAKPGLPAREAEAFSLIRAHLRSFNLDRELSTLLVVSADADEGKSTVARHLASVSARMGSEVLLLEADLRRPTLARQLGLQPGPGISDVLLGAVSLSEATQVIHLHHPPEDDSGGRILDVAVAGAETPPNPGELIESEAMQDLLEHARFSYDLVVIDTPPLIALSDAFSLLGEVDGVIVVGRVGRSRRDVVERLHEILTDAGAPLLGVIANGVKLRRRSSDGYGPAEPRRVRAAAPSANWSSPNGVSPHEQLVSAQPERPLAVLYGEAVDLPPAVADPLAGDAD